METVIEAKHLGRRFVRGDICLDAVKDVSFTVKPGEILGIVGESGCGKSTLLKLLTGIELPDQGEIFLEGKKLEKKRSRENYRTMQMIFQDAGASFHPKRKIKHSIMETMKNLRGSSSKMQVRELVSSIGLDPALAERYPGSLSGGQCQRMAIARAMSVNPRLLLCDEITSALDVSAQAQVLRVVAGLCGEGQRSIIFVSHDLAVVSSICDYILVMKQGSIVEEGETRAILEHPGEPYTQQLLSSVLDIE